MSYDLDPQKLKQFLQDYKASPAAAHKKWGDNLIRSQSAIESESGAYTVRLSPQHMAYTLIAHSRGRIHARHLGTWSVYEQHAPQPRPDKDGNMIITHTPYHRINKGHFITIDTLDDQTRLIGDDLLKAFQLSKAGKIQRRIEALQQGILRLTRKKDKLQGRASEASAAV